MLRMARSFAEGESRAKINRALGSIGVQLSADTENRDYCVTASIELVRAVIKRADKVISSVDVDDRFIGGLFAFVAGYHFSKMIGAQVEIVCPIAASMLFPPTTVAGSATAGDIAREVADSFNRMAREGPEGAEGQVLDVIGKGIVLWIEQATEDPLGKLAGLFLECRKRIALVAARRGQT